jgi:hypothetical protein
MATQAEVRNMRMWASTGAGLGFIVIFLIFGSWIAALVTLAITAGVVYPQRNYINNGCRSYLPPAVYNKRNSSPYKLPRGRR